MPTVIIGSTSDPYASQRSVAAVAARTIGPAVAAQTVDIIEDGGAGELNMSPLEFEQFMVWFTITFAYTGGTANPTMVLYLQRKTRPDQLDTEATAWQDIASFSQAADATKVARLGGGVADANPATPVQDALTANTVVTGHPGAKIRLREKTTGGDRTGGTATYSVTITGVRRNT